jgi:hypothetical protein
MYAQMVCVYVGSDMTAKDDMLQLAWILLGLGAFTWIIYEIKETAFQNGYWKGREAGWQSHRRLTNIRAKSDEVFDYDKN